MNEQLLLIDCGLTSFIGLSWFRIRRFRDKLNCPKNECGHRKDCFFYVKSAAEKRWTVKKAEDEDKKERVIEAEKKWLGIPKTRAIIIIKTLACAGAIYLVIPAAIYVTHGLMSILLGYANCRCVCAPNCAHPGDPSSSSRYSDVSQYADFPREYEFEDRETRQLSA